MTIESMGVTPPERDGSYDAVSKQHGGVMLSSCHSGSCTVQSIITAAYVNEVQIQHLCCMVVTRSHCSLESDTSLEVLNHYFLHLKKMFQLDRLVIILWVCGRYYFKLWPRLDRYLHVLLGV